MNCNFTPTAKARFGLTLYLLLLLTDIQNLAAQSPYCAPLYNNSCDATGGFGVYISQFDLSKNGVPLAAIPTDPCATYDIGDVHDYTIQVIECPTLTKMITKRINIPCVGGEAIGELNLKAGGGTAPYTYNMSGQTNTNGVFTNLKPSDYALIITDNNGCSTSFTETLESSTNFSKLNDATTTQDWIADSISQTLTYLTGANAVLTPLNDSLAKYNRGASDSISKYIPLGFSFQFDNFYYDSLVVSENGAVSFNPHINPLTVSSQWFDNDYYKGRGNGGGGNSSDCDTAFLDNPLPFIAAFRDDLQANNSGNVASQINYKLSGVAPNRVFTVEWRNMQWHKVCNSPRNNAVSVQLLLYEGSNKVEMNYKAEPNLAANCDRTETGYGYTVGLFGRRLGNGHYIAYNPEEGTTTRFENTYDPTNPTLHAGVTTNNAYFPDGKRLKFTPPPIDASCAPLSITSVKATCSSGADGTITIVAAGGILSAGTYYFSKDGGVNYLIGSVNATLFIGSGNTGTFFGLSPGTYTIAVHDNPIAGNGSPNNWSFVTQTIVVPDATVSGTTEQKLTCNGDVSGAIQFNWAKSSATYDLKFKKIGGTLSTFNGLTDTFKLFTGLSAGTYNVTVTFTDLMCSSIAKVTLADPPVSCKPATIQLNALGTATLTLADIDNNPTGNCGFTQRSLSKTAFDCSNLGSNTVIFSATDASGNSVTCSAIVTIEDKIAPSVNCKPATLQLNAMGNATLTIAQIDNNSTDNCGITQRSLSKTAFNCSNLGTNTVIFSTTDASGNSATCSAIVTIEDKIAPSVFCKPATLQLNAMGNATLTIAQIDNNSTDNCSITQRSLSKTAFDCSNLGSNTVIFTATDAAGNTATCSTIVTVEDKIAPIITCPDNISVKLGSGECRRVLYFSATATDNCTASPTVTQLSGLQSGQVFGISTFNTGFKATDASGNTSSCLFNITVSENLPTGPMVCRNQINVVIDENCYTRILPGFFLSGNNYGCFDNYGIQLQTLGGTYLPDDYVTSRNINATLKAIITDKTTGNSCTGTFKVFDATPPTIQAPEAIAVTCDNVPFNGIPDTSITGVPKILKECSLTSMHFSDKLFDIDCGVNLTAPPAGFPTDLPFDLFLAQNTKRIIVRTFTVYDIYNNSSTTRQTIYIAKNQISAVTFTRDINTTCGNRRIEPTDTIIDGITIRGMGYPSLPGKYSLNEGFCPIRANYSDVRTRDSLNNSIIIKRSWDLVNTCTNETRAWVQTIVYRDTPPELSLLQNAVFQIQSNGRVTVKANDLISRLTDDCTPTNKIIYGLRIVGRAGTGFPTQTSYTFDCNQKGTYNIAIWVKDDIGNIVIHTTSFTVNDDLGNCPKIGGIIQRENLMDVPANIVLYNDANNLIDSTTGSSYFFKNLSANNRYRVVPSRPNTDWLNGVTMFDVALMSRHLLGTEPLATPYRLIGADVNRNGEVDAVDMLLMQRLILRITSVFPSNNSWRFVVKNYAFIDPTNPFASDFPETLLVPSLSSSVSNGDFVAIKTGDVNLSAGSVDIRSGIKPFVLSVDDIVLQKNKTYQIPIKITPYQREYNGGNLSALQFSLDIDKNAAQIENTTKGDLPNCSENNVAIFKNEGIVTAAWYRSPNQQFIETDTFTLLNLTISPTKNTRLSQILSINPIFTEGVAYDEIGNGAAIKLSFGNMYKTSEKATLLPSRPNPFSNETTISFLLPEAGLAKLTVCDLLGRVLMTTEKAFSKGLNEVVFSSKDTPSVSRGILVVRLQTENGLAEQKIVFSR